MDNTKVIEAANNIDLDVLQAQIKSVERKAAKISKAGDYDAADVLFDKASEFSELKVAVEGYRREREESNRESVWAYRYYYSLSPWEEENSQRLIEEHDNFAEEYLKDIARILKIED